MRLRAREGEMSCSEDVKFWIVSLDKAMESARHDEPEFWERWADRFQTPLSRSPDACLA
jgi:hypothetical protein